VPKIVMIGAGSAIFTRVLLGDIFSFAELADADIALHDIDSERLDTAEAVARWTADTAGASPTITSHLDRRAALDGADYVINLIQVGGYDASVIDFEVPMRHGVRQTLTDTLGIGGIFRSLRTVPVLQGIAADMHELCPDAWLLNYTNPMAMLCWAVYSGTPVQRVVGLCHSLQNTTAQLAGYVGVPLEEVTFWGAGVNHQAWILRFERDGEDLYPRLDEVIERDENMRRKVRVDMYRRFGYFPTESSEHSSEYVPWYLKSEEAIERFRLPLGEWLNMSHQNMDEYEEIKRLMASGAPAPIESSVEYAPQIIHSMETGTPRVIYGTVENAGLIENLPRGAGVEVPCTVDASGVHGMHVGHLPPQCAALNRSFLNVCELTVSAALEGRRDRVVQAALLDPNTAATLTPDQIEALVDDLIDAHGAALPEGIRSGAVTR
jgi:alpha-galactosidase